MDRDAAIARLEALMQAPGTLRIITNEHACGGGVHPSIGGAVNDAGERAPWDQEACDAFAYKDTSPLHFVRHDVVRLEQARGGPGERGQMIARSAEGDWTQGQPEALLSRLIEALIEAMVAESAARDA